MTYSKATVAVSSRRRICMYILSNAKNEPERTWRISCTWTGDILFQAAALRRAPMGCYVYVYEHRPPRIPRGTHVRAKSLNYHDYGGVCMNRYHVYIIRTRSSGKTRNFLKKKKLGRKNKYGIFTSSFYYYLFVRLFIFYQQHNNVYYAILYAIKSAKVKSIIIKN